MWGKLWCTFHNLWLNWSNLGALRTILIPLLSLTLWIESMSRRAADTSTLSISVQVKCTNFKWLLWIFRQPVRLFWKISSTSILREGHDSMTVLSTSTSTLILKSLRIMRLLQLLKACADSNWYRDRRSDVSIGCENMFGGKWSTRALPGRLARNLLSSRYLVCFTWINDRIQVSSVPSWVWGVICRILQCSRLPLWLFITLRKEKEP